MGDGIGCCAGACLNQPLLYCKRMCISKSMRLGWSWVWPKIKKYPSARTVAGWLDLIADEFPQKLGPFVLAEVPFHVLWEWDTSYTREDFWGIDKDTWGI